jgi:WD40 repeat protein
MAMFHSSLSQEEIANLNREWARLNDLIPRLENRLQHAGSFEEFDIAQELNAKRNRKIEIEQIFQFNEILRPRPVREATVRIPCRLKEKFIAYLLETKIVGGRILSVAWSPDSTMLATSNWQSIRIWNAITGTQIGPNLVHDDTTAALWSPDGTKLATRSITEITLWDIATGTQIGPNLQHGGTIELLGWSPDGSRLITQADNSAQIWDAATGTQIGADLLNIISPAVLSPDGNKLAAASNHDGTELKIWDITTRTQIGADIILQQQLRLHTYLSRESIQWSPDGTKLITSSLNNVKIWDAATGTQIGPDLTQGARSLMAKEVEAVAWNPDGVRLAVAYGYSNDDSTIIIWNGATGRKIGPDISLAMHLNSMAWNPDGSNLALASSRSIKIFDISSRKQIGPNLVDWDNAHPMYNGEIAWSPDGSKLAAKSTIATADRGIRIWNMNTHSFLRKLNINQCELLRAFEQLFYREQFGKPAMPIQATALQWETFTTLPQSIQNKVRRFIIQAPQSVRR